MTKYRRPIFAAWGNDDHGYRVQGFFPDDYASWYESANYADLPDAFYGAPVNLDGPPFLLNHSVTVTPVPTGDDSPDLLLVTHVWVYADETASVYEVGQHMI